MTKVASAAVNPRLPRWFRGARWVAHPGAYAVSSPLLSICIVGAGLMIPALLGPAEFGRYTVAELFGRYLVIADLGLLLMLDRRVPALLAAGDAAGADRITQHILWTRIVVGVGVGFIFFVASTCLVLNGHLGVGLAAAVGSGAFGILSLIASGPVGAWRASSHYRRLALSSAFVNVGLSLPRVIGAWLGGVAGCFLALAVWFGSCAAILHRYLPLQTAERPSFRTGCALVAESLPLFAASFGWSLYLPENRWVYAAIAGPAELGQFAFGSSMLMVVVTTISITGNVYYPKLAGRIATTPPYAFSQKLLRDLSMVIVVGGACCVCAIVLLPVVVKVAYPRFIEGVPAARILLASGPPLLLASWLMQLIIAVGKRPWVDALTIYPASLLAVALGIILGHAAAGMAGAAEGSVAGALVCPTLQLVILWRSAVIRLQHAVALMLLGAATVGALTAITLAVGFVEQ